MKCSWWTAWALAMIATIVLTLTGTAGTAVAGMAGGVTVPAGSEVQWWAFPADSDTNKTGVRIKNLVLFTLFLVAFWSDLHPQQPGDTVPPPYELTDGSMDLSIDGAPGDYIAQITLTRPREMVRDLDLQTESLELFKKAGGSLTWERPQDYLQAAGLTPVYMPRLRADMIPGHYGYWEHDENVSCWATHTGSLSTWAAGALPEPASIVCLAAGSVLMLWRRRRRPA